MLLLFFVRKRYMYLEIIIIQKIKVSKSNESSRNKKIEIIINVDVIRLTRLTILKHVIK